LSGIWQVNYSGRFYSGCRTPGSVPTPTFFRFTQNGDAVAGTIFDVDVSGVLSADGRLNLNGEVTRFGATSVVRSSLRVPTDLSGFTGSFTVFLDGSVPCGRVIEGQILSTERVPTTGVSNFDAEWSGTFGVEDCSPFVGYTDCFPVPKGAGATLVLRLVQTGSTVTGTLRLYNGVMAVTGAVAGGRLVLDEASVAIPISGGQDVVWLTQWSSTRDEFGRMTGTFSYTFERTLVGRVLLSTSHNTLVSVTLKPAT
jgi:hypothetical protein